MDLPSGIITFLFTEVEGSTKLWKHYAQIMAALHVSMPLFDIEVFTRTLASAWAALSEAALHMSWDWGGPMSLGQAVAFSGEAQP